MKVPTSDGFLLNLEAPTVAAFEVTNRSHVRWFMWCTHCCHWHIHGPGEGHREAHCNDDMSPYYRHGYNLALAGKLTRKEIEACEKSGRGPQG